MDSWDLTRLIVGGVFLIALLGLLVGTLLWARDVMRGREYGINVGLRTYTRLDRFLAEFSAASGLAARRLGLMPRLENASFSGEIADRRATVSFERDRTHLTTPLRARFAVAAPRAPHFRVLRDSWTSTVEKTLGLGSSVPTGDVGFDKHYLVHAPTSGDRERVRSQLGKDVLREAIDALFQKFAIESIELKGDELIATGLPVLGDPVGARPLLEALVAAANALDRVTISVKVLGGERPALRGRKGKPRCAYCHADITGEELDLVACDRCHTVLHAGCFEELGRCPVLGCEGQTPERARSSGGQVH